MICILNPNYINFSFKKKLISIQINHVQKCENLTESPTVKIIKKINPKLQTVHMAHVF